MSTIEKKPNTIVLQKHIQIYETQIADQRSTYFLASISVFTCVDNNAWSSIEDIKLTESGKYLGFMYIYIYLYCCIRRMYNV